MSLIYGIATLGKYTSTASVASMVALGPTFVRVQVHNKSVEYAPPVGSQYFYKWSVMDAQVLPWINAGFSVVLTLEGFNTWWLDPTCGLPNAAGMLSWGTAVINRYGSAIVGVEMGNEEYAFASGSCRNASVYIGVISSVYTQLKALNPSLTIGMFGYTSYNGQNTNTNGNPAYWFQQFVNGGGDPYIDYYNCHMYKNLYGPTVQTPNGCPPVATVIGDIVAAINSISSSKKIRVTEFGYQGLAQAGTNICPNYIGGVLQVNYEVQFFQILSAIPQVTHGFLYTSGAALANFGDCHDIQPVTVTYNAMQTLFAGGTPVLPTIPGLAQLEDHMSFTSFTEPNNQATLTGGLTIVKDALTQDAASITCAGVIQGTNIVGAAAVLGAIASSATINTAGVDKASAAPAAAVTGIILQKGTIDGQKFSLVNLGTSTSTITFAAAATSNVNGGTGTSVAITSCDMFVWDAGSALWYLV